MIIILAGCGSSPPAGVIDRPVVAAPTATLPQSPASALPQHAPDALFHALAALGVDYRWGGNSRAQGFDCSGLVQHVYREAYGVELPRLAQAQSRSGQPVSHSELEIGDLVFYNTQKQPYSHVGIYMGDGRFIHAPKTGAAVRVEKMSSKYWASRFDGARRVAQN